MKIGLESWVRAGFVGCVLCAGIAAGHAQDNPPATTSPVNPIPQTLEDRLSHAEQNALEVADRQRATREGVSWTITKFYLVAANASPDLNTSATPELNIYLEGVNRDTTYTGYLRFVPDAQDRRPFVHQTTKVAHIFYRPEEFDRIWAALNDASLTYRQLGVGYDGDFVYGEVRIGR